MTSYTEDSSYIYRFLSTLWEDYPTKERQRFAELWKGYEQVLSDVYQELLELKIALNIDSIPAYAVSRWDRYTFDIPREVPAVFVSFATILTTVDLSTQKMLQISIDGVLYTIDASGAIPAQTTITEVIQNINNVVGVTVASAVYERSLIQLTSTTTGPKSNITLYQYSNADQDATPLIFGLELFQLPYVTPLYPFSFSFKNNVHKIPSLQDSIKTDVLGHYYVEGLDYIINKKTSSIDFRERPPLKLWAKDSYTNIEAPYYNYGYLVDYRNSTLPPEDYLEVVQSIWFAYWHGPRPLFMRQALCLILGLPVAAGKGIVTRFKKDVLEILHIDGTIKAYVLPTDLKWLVVEGQYVEKFQPLCTGVEVYDKTSLPGFMQTEVGYGSQLDPFALPTATRGPGDTDETKALSMLEEHTYLPQVDVNAFVRPDAGLSAATTFLKGLQPLHKTFQFQVSVITVENAMEVSEEFGWDYVINVTPNLEINQRNTNTLTVKDDYEVFPNNALNLDSDTLSFGETGEIRASDTSGALPQYDVNFS